MTTPHKRHSRGFTLIETSIASLVFTVAVITIGYMAINSIRLLKRTGDISVASNLASATMEGLMVGLPPNADVDPAEQITFDQLSGTSLPYYFSRQGKAESTYVNNRYTVVWEATPDVGGSGVFTDVVVRAYWNESGHAPEAAEDATHTITIRGRVIVP